MASPVGTKLVFYLLQVDAHTNRVNTSECRCRTAVRIIYSEATFITCRYIKAKSTTDS
jgi:hypothetical protein